MAEDDQHEALDPKTFRSVPSLRFGSASPVACKLSEPVVQLPWCTAGGDKVQKQGQEPVSSGVVTPPTLVSPASSEGSRKSWSELVQSSGVSSRPSPLKKGRPPHPVESLCMRRIPAEKVGDPHSGSGEEGESESDYESLPELQFSWRCLQTGQRLVPSGLANYGNMCFLNSVSSSPGMTVTNRIGCGRQILQSLIHCPPFSNTFARLHDRLAFLSHRRAPFLRAIDDLIAAHEIAPRNESLSAGDRSCRTLVPDLLYECFREFSQSKRLFHGAQEDAQEFLTFLIDQLHEELLKNRKLLNWRFDESSGEARSHGIGDARGGEWLEVGKRGVTLTRAMEHHHSPISFLFFGQYRSVVRRARGKDSVTMEPFHCVSLEINDSSIASLADAFVHMSRPEPIDGEAITKTVTIGTAPPILIIHLKRFYYHAVYGVEKLGKFIQYPEYLELGGAPRGGVKSDDSYRLFAVIYHHGRTADGGHYTCHVRDLSHPGGAGGELLPWMYFDDASMTEQSLGTVLADKGSAQSAYLLFYIRHGPVG